VKELQDHTIKEYSEVLSLKVPVPGGGSAAALTGALGASLISMVVNYSLGKKTPETDKKLNAALEQSEVLRKRLLVLVDLDAQAYLGVVQARKGTDEEKKKATKHAREVPLEIAECCYKAMELTPVLVVEGNKYLLSDVEVAMELLGAAFQSAMVNVRINS
jgi:formiminotetrahydrofolate cyclodeaminase